MKKYDYQDLLRLWLGHDRMPDLRHKVLEKSVDINGIKLRRKGTNVLFIEQESLQTCYPTTKKGAIDSAYDTTEFFQSVSISEFNTLKISYTSESQRCC